MKKIMVKKENIENISELEDLPEGKVLLLGAEIKESGLESFFSGKEREIKVLEDSLPIGERGSAYGEFALAIATQEMTMRESENMERLFLELSSTLVNEGILVVFFCSESTAKEMNGVFLTNREIEQAVSRLLTVERIATMMDGTRRVVARKKEPSLNT